MALGVVAAVWLMACGGSGEPEAQDGGSPQEDASLGDAPAAQEDGPPGPQLDAGSLPCIEGKPNGPPAHAAGTDCVSCHGPGEAPPLVTVGGTVYASASGSTGRVAGATVFFTDATGKRIEMVTDVGGNFFTSQSVSFPLSEVGASKCPDIALCPEAHTHGSCNVCHTSGTRIHLP